jgi:hypothetical protein
MGCISNLLVTYANAEDIYAIDKLIERSVSRFLQLDQASENTTKYIKNTSKVTQLSQGVGESYYNVSNSTGFESRDFKVDSLVLILSILLPVIALILLVFICVYFNKCS